MLDSKNQVAFIYPGQGSQGLGMGKSFRDNFIIARELIQRASDCLHIDMVNLLDNDEDKLNQTQYTQPAIFLVSAMAHEILKQEYGIIPHICFGHSLGEVSAYCLNGSTNFDDAITLTYKRGELMFAACNGLLKTNSINSEASLAKDVSEDSKTEEVGMLVCLGLKSKDIESLCQNLQQRGLRVWTANYNLETQTVLAGIKDDLQVAAEECKQAGAKRAMLLKMNVASHCPLLQDAVIPFKELLDVSLQNSEVHVISNSNLDLYSTKQQALYFLTEQLVKPVLYYKSVLKAKDMGITQFIELGHGNVLAGLNNKIADIPTLSINGVESLRSFNN
ncbi:ACP S-malonyltransferase [Helicobacter muridarum]|uniref:Malonyl CoA-acyl carrier protein transacylase n=1 Tax=Helicobacter muridarum TaxID=216 RepID=A0A099U0W4_9HELI|nr:ACP S-malonyltransferase [Helicobacter muridarum]TLE01400.1 ACP S-malonyltransferase [Helicobacter muridarum]STQ85329.1 acyl-carrier-protein S-malonyltransferase [Helicobacter muridarum]